MKILWISKYRSLIKKDSSWLWNRSARLRATNFHEAAKGLGVDSTLDRGERGLALRCTGQDVIVFQKALSPRWLPRVLRRTGKLVVWDVCDPLDPATAKSASAWCDVIITSSYELAESIRSLGCEVPVHHVTDHHESDPDWNKEHTPLSTPVVSWYGDTVNFRRHIERLVPIIKDAGFDFRLGVANVEKGFPYAEEIEYRIPMQIGWRQENSWQKFVQRSDVGIGGVLEGDIKAPHKGLNYMAAGIPVICAGTENYRRIIRHGENGMLADTDEDWMGCLNTLKDVEARRKIGAAARADVLDRYSASAQTERYLQIISSLIDQKRGS